jgi:thioredoxin 1
MGRAVEKQKAELEGMHMAAVLELDDGSFPGAIREGVILVDFWAPWCAPCLVQGPIVERVAEMVGDRVKIAKVNIDEARQAADKLGIRAIPTVILFKDGKPVQQFVGVKPEGTLLAAIEAVQ